MTHLFADLAPLPADLTPLPADTTPLPVDLEAPAYRHNPPTCLPNQLMCSSLALLMITPCHLGHGSMYVASWTLPLGGADALS